MAMPLFRQTGTGPLSMTEAPFSIILPQEIPDHGQPQQGYDPHIHIEQKLLCCTDTAAPAFCHRSVPVPAGNVISFPVQKAYFPDIQPKHLILTIPEFPAQVPDQFFLVIKPQEVRLLQVIGPGGGPPLDPVPASAPEFQLGGQYLPAPIPGDHKLCPVRPQSAYIIAIYSGGVRGGRIGGADRAVFAKYPPLEQYNPIYIIPIVRLEKNCQLSFYFLPAAHMDRRSLLDSLCIPAV